MRFVVARDQTDSMMTFGDTVVGHAATKRQQAAAFRNAGASAERVIDREAFGSAQARLRFVAACGQTDSRMTFENTVVRHAATKRRQAAALRNAGASAERPVHREAFGSAQARLRFVAACGQTDSMMIFGDTVVGHAKTKRQQAAALRNAGAFAERAVNREALGSAQARLRFVVARDQTDSRMTFENTVVRHAATKRRQAAALRNAGAFAERPVHREAFGVRKLACALL